MTHKVVSIERDVEGTSLHRMTGNTSEDVCDSFCNRNTTTPNTNQCNIVNPAVAFNNFVRDTGKGPSDTFRLHHYRHKNL